MFSKTPICLNRNWNYLKFEKRFEEVGTNGNYDPLTLQGDSTTSHLIASYVTFKQTKQGLSGVLPKSAVTIEKTKEIDS